VSDARGVPAADRHERFTLALVLILLGGAILRLAYTVAEASTDPWFGHPVLDGRYYVDWAIALASGKPGPAGAFYLAPLYPYALAGLMRVAGPGFWAIYLVQQGLSVSTAALVALGGRRPLGDAQALSAAALLLLYQPILFFAARPLGETLAIALLAVSLVAAWRATPRAGFVAGFASGLASLARPNLLLVPLVWSAWDVRQARLRRVAALLLGVGIAVLPITLSRCATRWSAVASFPFRPTGA